MFSSYSERLEIIKLFAVHPDPFFCKGVLGGFDIVYSQKNDAVVFGSSLRGYARISAAVTDSL
jgi:hypothetical protein